MDPIYESPEISIYLVQANIFQVFDCFFSKPLALLFSFSPPWASREAALNFHISIMFNPIPTHQREPGASEGPTGNPRIYAGCAGASRLGLRGNADDGTWWNHGVAGMLAEGGSGNSLLLYEKMTIYIFEQNILSNKNYLNKI